MTMLIESAFNSAVAELDGTAVAPEGIPVVESEVAPQTPPADSAEVADAPSEQAAPEVAEVPEGEPPATEESSPFAGIADDDLTADELAMKKRLEARFTKARQADADKVREAEEVANARVAELEERLAAVEGRKGDEVDNPIGQPDFTEGLGNLLSPADLETVEDYATFVQQQIAIAIGQLGYAVDQRIAERIAPVENYVATTSEKEALNYIDGFINEHPMAEQHMSAIHEAMVNRRLTIDEAYAVVVGPIEAEKAAETAAELGRKAGYKAAEQTLTAKQQISVPSATPSVGVETPVVKGRSMADIFNEAVAESGVAFPAR